MQWSKLLLDSGVCLLLFAALAAVYALDMRDSGALAEKPPVAPEPPEPEEPPPPPPPQVLVPPPSPIDPTPRIRVDFRADGRFGVQTTTGDPDDPTDDNKRLTYDTNGGTNNTRVHVDGATPLYGGAEGRITQPIHRGVDGKTVCRWKYREVEVEQQVELVAGDLSRRMDTIRVTYGLRNTGSSQCMAGLRVMLDTLIGSNDGVPFIVPGHEGVVTTPQSYRGEHVPGFVRALEFANLTAPGVIVDIGLSPRSGERVDEVALTHWPGAEADWDYDRAREFGNDSAVGLYYEPRPLAAGASRSMEFTYGLGTISSTRSKNAALSLTAGGPFLAGGQFWLVALVQYPKAGQRVRLILSEGLSFAENQEPMKAVPAGKDYTQISWLLRVAPNCIGKRKVRAVLEPGSVEEQQVFDIVPRKARLILVANGPFQSGKPFWVSAVVQHPRAGQSLVLTLPAGLTFARGHLPRKEVAHDRESCQVDWLLLVEPRTSGWLELAATLEPEGVREAHKLEIGPASLVR
jgi:hypothetical protein